MSGSLSQYALTTVLVTVPPLLMSPVAGVKEKLEHEH